MSDVEKSKAATGAEPAGNSRTIKLTVAQNNVTCENEAPQMACNKDGPGSIVSFGHKLNPAEKALVPNEGHLAITEKIRPMVEEKIRAAICNEIQRQAMESAVFSKHQEQELAAFKKKQAEEAATFGHKQDQDFRLMESQLIHELTKSLAAGSDKA